MAQDSFLDSLKTYLHQLTVEGPAASPDTAAPVIDPVWARRMLLRVLERVEQGESSNESWDVAMWLDAWQSDDRIIVFVRELARLLSQSLAADEPAAVLRLIELGLARYFDLEESLHSRVRERQLDRLVSEAKELAWRTSRAFAEPDVARYATSNQLTVRKNGLLGISAIGEILQQLQGREAVRWLLHVEVQMALGELDPDRLSKEAASAILRTGSWLEDESDERGSFLCHPNTASRLHSQGNRKVVIRTTGEL